MDIARQCKHIDVNLYIFLSFENITKGSIQHMFLITWHIEIAQTSISVAIATIKSELSETSIVNSEERDEGHGLMWTCWSQYVDILDSLVESQT